MLQLLKLPDGTVKVLVEGAQRGKVLKYTDRSDYYEASAVVLEGRRIERFPVVSREMKLDRPEPSVGHPQSEPLDHEGRVVRLEPVLLALAYGEPPAVGLASECQHEEAEGRRVHDLRAVVEDVPLAVDLIAVLAHRNNIVGCAAGLDNAAASMSTFGVRSHLPGIYRSHPPRVYRSHLEERA